MRDSLQQAPEKIFDVGLYLTVYGDNEDELNKIETEIKSILDAKLVYVKPAPVSSSGRFQKVFARRTTSCCKHYKLNSTPSPRFFPFVSFDLTSNKGAFFTASIVTIPAWFFDRFSLENYNSVIFAKSGSGKSYATKIGSFSSLMFDADVIVIDPEREYEFLADAVGGRYFNISLTSDASHQSV